MLLCALRFFEAMLHLVEARSSGGCAATCVTSSVAARAVCCSQVPRWALLHRLWHAFARRQPAFDDGLAVRLWRWLEHTLSLAWPWRFTILHHVAVRSKSDATVIISL